MKNYSDCARDDSVITYHNKSFIQWLILDVITDEFCTSTPRVQFRIRQRTSFDICRYKFLRKVEKDSF